MFRSGLVGENTNKRGEAADILALKDYYPFGQVMPGRSFSSENYRYGFNGKETDDEMKGDGNSLDFGARMYDPRLGRWMSGDPYSGQYVPLSPYSYAANSPLMLTDKDGNKIYALGKNGKWIEVKVVKNELNEFVAIANLSELDDPQTVEVLNALMLTDYGKEAIVAANDYAGDITFGVDNTTVTGSHYADQPPTVNKTITFFTNDENWKGSQEKDRFLHLSKEEFLNVVGIHEILHATNKNVELIDEGHAPNQHGFLGEMFNFNAEWHALQQLKIPTERRDLAMNQYTRVMETALYKRGLSELPLDEFLGYGKVEFYANKRQLQFANSTLNKVKSPSNKTEKMKQNVEKELPKYRD